MVGPAGQHLVHAFACKTAVEARALQKDISQVVYTVHQAIAAAEAARCVHAVHLLEPLCLSLVARCIV